MLHVFIGREQSHLGDMWTLANLLVQLSLRTNVTTHDESTATRFSAILASFADSSTHISILSGTRRDGAFAPDFDDYTQLYARRYLPTRMRWTSQVAAASTHVCYCFDARWNARDKVPPFIAELKGALHHDFNGIDVSLPMPLDEAIRQLAICRCFVTVDTGLAHVARSIGCPIGVLRFRHPLERAFPAEACVISVLSTLEESLGYVADSFTNLRLSAFPQGGADASPVGPIESLPQRVQRASDGA